MVVVEPHNKYSDDGTTLISFWDLRDEPYIFKEHNNILDMVPSEILSEYELGGCKGGYIRSAMHLSRSIMAIYLQFILKQPRPLERQSYQTLLLLYRVNTTEPSQDTEYFHLLKTMKHVENRFMWHPYGGCTVMNDKYLIHKIVDGGKCSLEVHEIETLLSSMDTRFAPRKILPILDGKYVLEPGMSDRLAVFDRKKNRLTILDLVSRNITCLCFDYRKSYHATTT